MKTFNSFSDARRFIEDMPICVGCYETHEFLCENVAQDLINYLYDKFNWTYGEPLPEFPEQDFWRLFETYEVT